MPGCDAWLTKRNCLFALRGLFREPVPGDAGRTVTWIREPGVHPFLRANIWHVKGRDRDLLVDAGMGIASLRESFPDLITDRTVLS